MALNDPPLGTSVPFVILILFTLVTFLNIPNRIEAIGASRPTVLFVALLSVCAVGNWEVVRRRLATREALLLFAIVAYVILSLPFVMWPGSVISKNLETYVRAVVYFFFVVAFVDSIRRLQIFVFAFVASQLVRVLEPLVMHITTGYWGGITYFSGESMLRLVGAPSDPVNGNGLAFVVVTALPFVHFWCFSKPTAVRMAAWAVLVPASVYTLILTASRSGMLALAIIVLGLVWFSKQRALWVTLIVVCVALAIPRLSDDQRDRYLSIVDRNTKQSAGAEGRITAWSTNLEVFSHRPIFGFGLGTSQEAGFNIAGDTHYAHNLYLETMIELGVIGFTLFMMYLFGVLRLCRDVVKSVVDRSLAQSQQLPDVLVWLPRAMLVWVAMCFLFSFASFGLSEYHLYLFGGLAVVQARLAASIRASAPTGLAVADDADGVRRNASALRTQLGRGGKRR